MTKVKRMKDLKTKTKSKRVIVKEGVIDEIERYHNCSEN